MQQLIEQGRHLRHMPVAVSRDIDKQALPAGRCSHDCLIERRCRDWVVVRSMISVGWACRPDGSVGDQQWWITRQITVAKAMQAVEV